MRDKEVHQFEELYEKQVKISKEKTMHRVRRYADRKTLCGKDVEIIEENYSKETIFVIPFNHPSDSIYWALISCELCKTLSQNEGK